MHYIDQLFTNRSKYIQFKCIEKDGLNSKTRGSYAFHVPALEVHKNVGSTAGLTFFMLLNNQ
jgi:hypothetical protein